MAGYPKKDKNGTYYFVLDAGKDSNGNRKRVKRRCFNKISEAKAAMAELMVELKNSDHKNVNGTIYAPTNKKRPSALWSM